MLAPAVIALLAGSAAYLGSLRRPASVPTPPCGLATAPLARVPPPAMSTLRPQRKGVTTTLHDDEGGREEDAELIDKLLDRPVADVDATEEEYAALIALAGCGGG